MKENKRGLALTTSRFFMVFVNIGFFVRNKTVKSRAFAWNRSNGLVYSTI